MRTHLFVICLAVASPLLALENDPCHGPSAQLTSLYEVRSVMMRSGASSVDVDSFVDRRVDELRGPIGDGTYRWVHYVRPSGEGTIEKKGHSVVAVEGEGSDHFEASYNHVFAVRIAVPKKRSLFNANNPVYLSTVHIRFTQNGRTREKEERINAWMNPDTSRTIDLGVIADQVDADLDAYATQKHSRDTLVEIHFRKAAAEDDQENPDYDTIVMLNRIRSYADPAAIDEGIARLERQLFPSSDSLPLLSIVLDLRRADELMRSGKDADHEKGEHLMKETLRHLH